MYFMGLDNYLADEVSSGEFSWPTPGEKERRIGPKIFSYGQAMVEQIRGGADS
jgi:hypothetical protein